MNLYLVQHGIPKPEEEDPERPLSDAGREEVQRVAECLRKAGIGVTQVFHSGKLRAKQTAEIFGDALKPAEGVSEAEGLKPLDDPKIWAEKIEGIQKDTMLVGHLPHMEKLASLLLCGSSEKKVVSFRMGGVVCLGRDEQGWSLKWAITPEVV